MRKRCYCGNSERGRVSEGASERPSEGSLRSLAAAPRRDALQLKFRREELFSVFLLLTPSSKGIQGREREERGDCAFDSALFRGILKSNVVLRGRKPCDGRCARVRHVMGRETFLIHLLSTLFLSLSLSDATDKQTAENVTHPKTSGRIRNFFGPPPPSVPHPQAPPPLPFLSMLAALFVPPLGDEARAMRRPSFTWCGDGEGRRT